LPGSLASSSRGDLVLRELLEGSRWPGKGRSATPWARPPVWPL
jgi:hypothetical protein